MGKCKREEMEKRKNKHDKERNNVLKKQQKHEKLKERRTYSHKK